MPIAEIRVGVPWLYIIAVEPKYDWNWIPVTIGGVTLLEIERGTFVKFKSLDVIGDKLTSPGDYYRIQQVVALNTGNQETRNGVFKLKCKRHDYKKDAENTITYVFALDPEKALELQHTEFDWRPNVIIGEDYNA